MSTPTDPSIVPEIHGEVAPGWEGVREAFAANFSDHGDVGASVALTVGGEFVVDLWAGTATYDGGEERPWASDSIINVWSTTKTMAGLCCLVLIDRGQLDPHAPIASYWPEFAAAGKEGVTAAHVLSHSAGLSGWDEPITMADFCDHDKLVALHAAQAPWWEPGTTIGYHAISQGYLLGEIVRRISGRSLGRFFAEEIAGPLGADFHIGTAAQHDARVAHVIPADGPPPGADALDPESVAFRTFANPVMDAAFSSTIPWRRAEIPAAGGHGNARSVALCHTPMACGGSARGVELLSPATVEMVFEPLISGVDLVLGTEITHGMGFGLGMEGLDMPNTKTCFWGGWGGSLAIIDVENQMAFGYVMNRMEHGTTGDLRAAGLLLAAYGALLGA